MAAVSTDPQRLIAVSLGKIQAARGQRGGVNLHKNLLVAGVIMKARTVYLNCVHGKTSSSSESEDEDIEEEEEGEEIEDDAIEDATDSCSSISSTPVSDCDVATHEVEPEQQEQDDAEHVAAETAPTLVDSACVDCDKENSPPEVRNTSTTTTTTPEKSTKVLSSSTHKDNDSTSCQRCTKRRFAEDTDVSGNSNHGSKRARTCISSSPSSNISTECKTTQNTDSSTQCEPEPMQTDNAQISSLVHRFNSGLTGFLSCSSANIQQDNNSTDNSTSSECNHVHTKDSHSVSCSSQIKEAFETLARPVALALSV